MRLNLWSSKIHAAAMMTPQPQTGIRNPDKVRAPRFDRSKTADQAAKIITTTTTISGFALSAAIGSACSKEAAAVVVPQNGHGTPVIARIGHSTASIPDALNAQTAAAPVIDAVRNGRQRGSAR